MRVLHVWDVAGVADTVAKYMDKIYGTKSKLLVREKFTAFGLDTHNAEVTDAGPYRFALKALGQARDYDIVHIHGFWKLVPWLKRLYHDKPVLITFHNITAKYKWAERAETLAKADGITYATPDIADSSMPQRACLILNPVDTDIFYDRHEHIPGLALTHDAFAAEEADQLAERFGLELFHWSRYTKPVAHSELGAFMAPFEYYIDVKRSPLVSPDIVTAMSRTGFEALAAGLKVIDYKGEVHEGLPRENRPEIVAETYYTHYRRLKGGNWRE